MAANTSFKIQCPSCEAMVPIRDPNLVGKKIDCPKCKYRFVVEEPDGDEAGDRPAKKAFKPKAKKGGNNVLILGGILGGVALIVLGVVVYMLMFAGGDTSPQKNVQPPKLAANSTGGPKPAPQPPPANPVAATPAADAQAPTKAAGAATTEVALEPGVQTQIQEISNLLPNDTQSVISINMDRLRNSTIGQQAFESPIGFRPETFKAGFGLGVEEMSWFIRAENFGQNWSFNVVKSHRPLTLADFQGPLGLKKGAKSPIQGRNYFVIAKNPLLDHLSSILQSELESRDAQKAKTKESSGPLTLALLDETTVVVADEDPMVEFLQANAEPQKKSQVVGGQGGDAAPGGAPANPGRGIAIGAPAGGRDGGQQFVDRNTYLTIEPPLKSMLDRLEQDKDNLIATMAQRLQSDPTIVNRVREATGFKQLEVRGMNILGVGLFQLNNEKCKGEVAVEFFREDTAKEIEDALKGTLAAVGQFLGLYLHGLKIDVEGASGGGPAAGGPAAGGPIGIGGRGAGGPAGGGPGGAAGGSGNEPKSTMKLERKGRTLILNLDLSLNERAYDRIYGLSQGFVLRAKGMVDMAGGEPRYYELVSAGTRYRTEAVEKEKKPANTYPRGTFPREEGRALSRTWPPNHRVSWMAGLLPFLGYQEVYDGIRLGESWRSENNVKQGAVLIPAFLNPRYERPTWWADVPSLGFASRLGATHFVGVAGVGIDAADYGPRDPNVAKKLGVFGYNRQTNVKDITDGLSNTVYMIQVPPKHQRPWIAGGGATVTGIPETRSVEPFVSTQAGKRGTYVLMCDGSVRFVKDDISDEVFKAMCTIKGGEEIADLNQVAPKVEPPKGPSMKTADSARAGGQ
jgi:hypothetical protein